MSNDTVLAMVMAGGIGKRLYPLTLDRSKPSVPFGGKFRIIDFVLSNFVNSGIFSIYVLVQYKSQSLIEHIRTGWIRQGVLGSHFITVVPPQMRRDNVQEWYRGTADAIYQNIHLIRDFNPSYVAVFGADHIYRMNIKEMLDFHKRKKADVSISCIPVKKETASSFGVVEVDDEQRITGFQEKPVNPQAIPYNVEYSFISMGNYIFNTDVLIQALEEGALSMESAHDFGKDVIPGLINNHNVFAYDFHKNRLPGLKRYEEKAYWRDVGTVDSFFRSNMDILGERPLLDLHNHRWPIYGAAYDVPSAKLNKAVIENSLVSEGAIINKAVIRNSIIGRSVILEEDVEIEDSIVMDFTVVKNNSRIKRAIIDRFNTIERDVTIGYDPEKDRLSYFLAPSGIVVLKRGARR